MPSTKEKNKEGTDISQFFNLILENFKLAAIFILNREGVILNINTGVQKTLGYSHEDLIGKNFSILFTERDRKKGMPQKEIKTVLEKGSDTDNNYILHKGGKEIWVHGESAFTEDDTGNIFIIKLVYDINDHKLMEQSLQEKNEELEKINKDLDTFVYTASHDLKAPINNIEALIHSLCSEITEESRAKNEVKELVEMINMSIEKFKATIDDLSIIRNAEEDMPTDISMVYFKDILEDVKFNLKELIKEASPVFIEDFSNAPSINFSRKVVRSVLQNLISNAIKYRSPERRPQITIITEKHDDEFILLKATDNGLGIREKDKSKIFSMYKRLHHHIEGSGVGMSIVKRMLDNSDSKIEVKSEVGKGTTFYVYFKILKQ